MPAKPHGPSLSDIAYVSRMSVKFGALFIVLFMVGRVLLNATISLYKTLNPPKPPPPTLGFGALPEIQFGDDLSTPKEFMLQTVTGGLPSFGEQAKVFFVPESKAGLLAVDNAKKQAAALGFVFQYEQVSQTTLRWTKTNPIPATLEINIVTGDISMKAEWASDPSFLVQKNLPNEQIAGSQAKAILQQAGLLSQDMATASAKISYLKALGTGYTPAVSYSEADFVQVDLSRIPVNMRYPIVGPDYSKGNARMILSGNKQAAQFVEFLYHHKTVEYDRFETYPLIPISEAWNMLQSGRGHIASVLPSDSSQVVIRDVQLGFFDPQNGENYMQPIYIFTGDKGFVGYIGAATSTLPQNR